MRPLKSLAVAALMTAASLPAAAEDAKLAALNAPDRTQLAVDGASRAWLASEWQAYAARFVAPEGRIRDNGNGDVSHSEGQGYGLLLAAKTGDAARFETIWGWTAKTLMVRPDGLAAWKWDPKTKAVADTNNATDGDILIAWALAEAAERFKRPDYRSAAQGIARAIGAGAAWPHGAGLILAPGLKGFAAGEQPDGPVINLSYWVFPGFPALQALAPEVDWAGLRRNGLALIEASRFGSFGLPTDWESLAAARPRPAANFPAAFGYNAIRIPLYLAMDGSPDARRALRRFAGAWTQTASTTSLVDSKEAAVTLPIKEPGYDLVLALARCVAGGQAIPPEMINRRSDFYYPETLRLLSVLAIAERSPACL